MSDPRPSSGEAAIAALASRLQRGADYAELRREAEAQVVRWVWATGPIGPLSPRFQAELGWGRATELAGAPTPKAGSFEHGFDALGRVVVVRLHGDVEGRFAEDFYRYRDDGAEVWKFGPDPAYKDLDAVVDYRLDGARPTAMTSLHRQGEWFGEALEYAGELLVTRRRTASNPVIGGTYRYAYDAGGRLLSIAFASVNGKTGFVYQRPTRGFAALLAAVKAGLLRAIPERVRALACAEPAFALALVYDPGSALSMLPPKLALGLESERRAWQASGAAREALWDAQAFGSFDDDRLELGAEAAALLADAAEMVPYLESMAAREKAHALLVAVAKRLNALDWSAVTPVSPDFVVYPVDLHMEHLDADMAAVPAAIRKRLRARGEL